MTGVFVAIEGVDGAGKTTQVEFLRQHLRAKGFDPLVVREPGGTPLGESLRKILLRKSELSITAEAELLLFLASRAQLYDEVIGPARAAGCAVVSDRYHLSTLVYQGIGRGLGEGHVAELCATVLGDRRPDLHVVLEIPVDMAAQRLGQDRDRIESDSAMLKRVVDGFSTTAGLPDDAIERIDGRGPPEDVAARVRGVVDDIL